MKIMKVCKNTNNHHCQNACKCGHSKQNFWMKFLDEKRHQSCKLRNKKKYNKREKETKNALDSEPDKTVSHFLWENNKGHKE